MGGIAGYLTTIKKGGTSTAFTDHPMTGTGVGPYQINDTTKRVLDPTVTPTFYEDDVAIEASDVLSVNYMAGLVTFKTTKTGAITVDGQYLPLTVIAGANEYSLKLDGIVLDDTDYPGAQANGGYRTRGYGLRDVTITIGRWDDLSKTFTDIVLDGTDVVIELCPGGGSEFIRGWFLLEGDETGGELEGQLSESLSFVLDGKQGAVFYWGE